MKIPFLIIVISIILAYIVTIISSLIPIRKLNKISPIEAIKDTKNVKIKKGKVETPKLVKLLFKEEGELAYKNTIRDKKRYRTITISIVTSMVLFLSVNYVLENGMNTAQEMKYYDVLLSSNAENNDKELVLGELNKKNLLDDYLIVSYIKQAKENFYELLLEVPSEEKLTKEAKTLIDKGHMDIKEIDGKKMTYSFKLSIVEGTGYDKLLKELGIEKLGIGECIIVDKANGSKTKYGNDIKKANLKVGDTVTLRNVYMEPSAGELQMLEGVSQYMQQLLEALGAEGTPNEEEKEEKEKIDKLELKVAGVLDNIEVTSPLNTSETWLFNILISEETAKALENDYYVDNSETLFIRKSDKLPEVQKTMDNLNEIRKEYMGDSVDWSSYQIANSSKAVSLIKKIVIYSFMIFIALLCCTNVYNIITSSISLRKRQIAELKSIGMSEKQIRKMLTLEGLFYGLDAVIYGLLISFFIIYLIYKFAIDNEYNLLPFNVPYISFTLCILVTYFVIFISVSRSKKKLKIENVIDVIRNENI